MAKFDQRKQHVNTQINAESVTFLSGDEGENLPPKVKLLLENEIQKYIKLHFTIHARSNTKVILIRPRKTTLKDWLMYIKFVVMMNIFDMKITHSINTQHVLHKEHDYDLQKNMQIIYGTERDWARIEIDKSGNIKTTFQAPTPAELDRLEELSKEFDNL